MNLDKDKKDNITYLKDTNGKKINKKKLIITIVVGILIAIFLIIFAVYAMNEEFRTFFDVYILRKDIEEDSLASIKVDNLSVDNVFAYSNYIAVLKDNIITSYNSSAKAETEINVEISTPIIDTNGDYVAIAEKNGQKLYLIYKNEIAWKKDLEGNISRINVNPNGYVSIILSGTSYKSVIVLYDNSGNELFKTYLASTIAVDTDISDDNKYISFAEINISGTLIQSNIKVISIDKAKENPSDSTVYKYSADAGSLALSIKYQSKSKLVCMYDDSIHVIENQQDRKILDLADNSKKISFADIDLKNYVVSTVEESGGLFSTKTAVTLLNTSTEKQNVYNLAGAVKGLYSYGDRVGVNLGLEVHFVDTNGWLVKKYTSSEEIRGIVMSNNIAGIIHKNKIEILSL